MVKGQRLRWALLLSALAASVIASVWPEQDMGTLPVQRPASRPVSATITPENSLIAEHHPDWVASDENPFASRGWVPPPPPAPIVESRTVVPVVDTTPPPLPPLPFKFLGQMVDGADRVIYLGLGEQVFLARTGEVLDGRYKVLAITPAQIEFELTADGTHQTLPLPAQEP